MQEILNIIKNSEYVKIRIDLSKDFPLHLIGEGSIPKRLNKIYLSDLIHSDDLPELVTTINEVISKKKNKIYVHSRIRMDGDNQWFLICCDLQKDKFALKSDHLSGILLNVSSYLDSTNDDPVINSFREKNADTYTDLNFSSMKLADILERDYLVKIQSSFKLTPGVYSAIYDENDKLICTPNPDASEFNYNSFGFFKRKRIRINHITVAHWVIASDDEIKILSNGHLLETLVATVSRIANAYVSLFKEYQNTDRANKLLSENIEQQMLINNTYNIILEQNNSETALFSVLNAIIDYMGINRVYIYSDNSENRCFKLLHEQSMRGKRKSAPEKINYDDFPEIFRQLEIDDLYYPKTSEHEMSRFGISSFLIVNLNADGRRSGVAMYRWHKSNYSPSNQDKKILRAVSQIIATLLIKVEVDIQLKETAEKLEHLAFYDLTLDIPNRAMLEQNLSAELEAKQKGAVISLKFTNMRVLNELFGHGYGDSTLKTVAAYISSTLSENMAVYRLSGSVIIIHIRGDDGKIAKQTAESLILRFKRPWVNQGNEHFLEAGIGITLYPENGEAINEILSAASLAMYKAIEYGINNFAFYNKEFERKAAVDYHYTQKLRASIGNEMSGFYLTYQPVVDLKTGALKSCEAFINWNDGNEWLPTTQIVRISENMGYDIYVDAWVIENACNICKRIQEEYDPDFSISVNITSRDLRSSIIIPITERALIASNLDAKSLYIEIDEGILSGQAENLSAIIGKLKSLGVGLIIDSFGKDLSAAALLKHSGIDLVKADFSLFSNVFDDFDDIMLDAVVKLSKTVKNGICVKRIEDAEQLKPLEKYDIGLAQGHLLSRPMIEAELLTFMADGAQSAFLTVNNEKSNKNNLIS